MSEYPDIKRSVVVVRENPESGQFLCGYFTASQLIDKARLTEHMKRSLTYYMIPGVLVQLDALPLTSNGKINKKALPEPEFTAEKRNFAEPETELQKQLCAMFAKAIGAEKVGIDENFFEIGGTSLSASKVAMQAMTANLPIVYSDIFDNPTVEALERRILSQGGKGPEVKAAAVEVKLEGVAKALAHNAAGFVEEITYTDIGNVLLTGATGFLGVHVLKELLKDESSSVYCLVRRGKSGKRRPTAQKYAGLLLRRSHGRAV